MTKQREESTAAQAAPLLPSSGGGAAEASREWTIDETLCHIGRGRFQFLLLIILGFTYMADACEMLLLSFIGPDVLHYPRGTLTAALFLGMATGSFLFGTLSDTIGRKPSLILDVGIGTLGGLASALAPGFYLLMLCRFVVGMGLGGFVLLLSMFSEFLPIDHRGRSLAAFQLFWGIGGCLEVVLAWAVLPHWHWRGLVLMSAIPIVLLLLVVPFLPESPRYLIVHGREEEAKNVLQFVARFNGVTLPADLKLKAVSAAPLHKTFSTETLRERFKSVFQPPLHRVTPAIWSTWVVAALGYYSVVVLTTAIQSEDSDDQACIGNHVHFSDNDFRDILIDASAEIPGTLFVYFTVDYFGRKKIWTFSLLAGASSLLLLPLTSTLYTVFLFSARFFMTSVYVVTLIFAPEVYPSSCRSFAVGLGNVLSRFGGGVSPFVAQSMYDACGLVAVAVFEGSLLLTVSFLSMFVPIETGGSAMQDTLQALQEDYDSEHTTTLVEP